MNILQTRKSRVIWDIQVGDPEEVFGQYDDLVAEVLNAKEQEVRAWKLPTLILFFMLVLSVNTPLKTVMADLG